MSKEETSPSGMDHYIAYPIWRYILETTFNNFSYVFLDMCELVRHGIECIFYEESNG